MNSLTSIKRIWGRLELPILFYHTTFIKNVPLILEKQEIVANKGYSICKENNGLVSLSDRLTQGIIEFFGSVAFEFDALSLYIKNKAIAPRDYGISEDEIDKYDDFPFFEDEWIVPNKVKFENKDINKVFLITGRNFRESKFEDIVAILKTKGIKYRFLYERHLPDNIGRDIYLYFTRLESWKKFQKFLIRKEIP